jgi:hypothetical protein
MPTPTYTPLATVTLGSSAASVTFSSIPATYRDLILVSQILQNTTGVRQAVIKPNGDAGNASLVFMDGSGSAATSATAKTITAFYLGAGPAANTPVAVITQIMDYMATDKHKTFLNRSGSSFDPVSAYASRWASTAAITSLVFEPTSGGNFSAGTTLNLYGVIA